MTIRKAWAVCWWLFMATSTLQAQNSDDSLSGTVFDEKGSPLPGATVFIEDLHRGEVTDIDGNFTFKNMTEGKYQLMVRYTGYHAQYPEIEVPQRNAFTLRLQTDQLLLENVIIAGHAINSSTAPESSLSEQEIESTRGQSLAQSLEKITGVSSLQTGAGIAKPMLQGLHSNNILIMNNGVRMEGQQWGAEHAPEIDPFTANKLSVIKGAASVKYGAEAIGGVVIVSPPELPATPGISGEAHLIGMSNGRLGTGSAMVEGGISAVPGLGWRLQGTVKRGGDAKAPDYYLNNTGIKEVDFSAAVGLHRNSFGLDIYYSHFGTETGILKTTGYIGSLADLEQILENGKPSRTDDFTYHIENPRQEVIHDLMKLNGHYLSPVGRLTLQYALQLNHRKEFDIRRGALNDIPSMNLKIATHIINLELKHKPLGPLEGSAGVDLTYQDNNNVPGTQRSNFIPNFTQYAGGLYVIERVVMDQWELEAGVRYDARHYKVGGWNLNEGIYKDAFGFHNFTASLGGVYRFNEHASFTTNLGSAWRPPHVAELYSFGKHQSTAGLEYGLLWQWDREATPPNNFYIQKFDEADIPNEQALKWINTYEYTSETLSVEISAYINRIRNFIYLRPEGVTESNVGALPYYWNRQTNATFAGIDASVNYQIISSLAWQTKLSYLRAKDTKNNDELPYIPANNIATGLRYEKDKWIGLDEPFARVEVAYTAKQRHAPRTIAIEELFAAAQKDENIFANDPRAFDFLPPPDAYTLVNLEAGFSKNVGDASAFQLRLAVNNLFNVSYRNYTNRLRYFADEPGRNFIISLKYNF